jgi:hypothetical protein
VAPFPTTYRVHTPPNKKSLPHYSMAVHRKGLQMRAHAFRKSGSGNARPAHDVLQHGPSSGHTTQARRGIERSRSPFPASLLVFLGMKKALLEVRRAVIHTRGCVYSGCGGQDGGKTYAALLSQGGRSTSIKSTSMLRSVQFHVNNNLHNLRIITCISSKGPRSFKARILALLRPRIHKLINNDLEKILHLTGRGSQNGHPAATASRAGDTPTATTRR